MLVTVACSCLCWWYHFHLEVMLRVWVNIFAPICCQNWWYVCTLCVCVLERWTVCSHLMQSEHSMSPLSSSSAGNVLPPDTAAVWKVPASSAWKNITTSAHMFLCVFSGFLYYLQRSESRFSLHAEATIKKKLKTTCPGLQCVWLFSVHSSCLLQYSKTHLILSWYTQQFNHVWFLFYCWLYIMYLFIITFH